MAEQPDMDPLDLMACRDAGVPLDNSRVTVVEDGGIGFDISCSVGVTQVRYADTTVAGSWNGARLVFSGLDMSTFGRPWYIAVGPDSLARARFGDMGEAVRAALRGWSWPESWSVGLEPLMAVDESTQP